jgi:hypothetical protein
MVRGEADLKRGTAAADPWNEALSRLHVCGYLREVTGGLRIPLFTQRICHFGGLGTLNVSTSRPGRMTVTDGQRRATS